MITFKELTDIASKLSILEELKEPLLSVIADINTLLQKGNSWIGNIENKTYQEMKGILEIEIADILKRCFSIASSGHQKVSEPVLNKDQVNETSQSASGALASTGYADDKNNELICPQIDQLTAKLTTHTELLKTIQEKCKNQEKNFKSVLKQTNERYEEMMKELHAASDFMSEKLNESKEKELKQEEKIQEVSQKLETYLELTDSNGKEPQHVETLMKEIKRLTDELEKSVEEINNKDKEIFKLKEEQANHHFKMKSKATIIVPRIQDLKLCVLAATKERGLDFTGVCPSYHNQFFCMASKGKDLLIPITQMLHNLGMTLSERDNFWDEYDKYINK